MKIIELEETSSTNEYCKTLAPCDCVVFARRQMAGKGTKGRSFSSLDGGIYLSVMRCYKNFPAKDAFKIMVNACVAVCKTLESFGINPTVRWANDVLVGGKKICGTLIENTFSGSNISRSIVGIGINVNNDLPQDLTEIATSMKDVLSKELPLQAVKKTLARNLEKKYTVADYKKYINWFGKSATLKFADGELSVTALDVAEDGRLIVEADGKIQKISAAEVSLRL